MTATAPYRVAIVGSGPSAFYTIGHLLAERDLPVEIDLFEKLPTPWGLVRAGVAPDHPEKKLVIERQFDFFLKNPRVRFFGNVEIGAGIGPDDLARWYDAVIYAVGGTGDTLLGVPGEQLPGCWSARRFVEFYNGHPDAADRSFDVSHPRAVIIGNGNVALDVARILTVRPSSLRGTDISDRALDVLEHSAVREVVVLGRRGPRDAAFNNPELEELEHLDEVDVAVEGADLAGPWIDAGADWHVARKLATLRRLIARTPNPANRRIVFRFHASPVGMTGDVRVQKIALRSTATNDAMVLDAGIVFRATGYRGLAVPGLPFDATRGVIRNDGGRVVDSDGVIRGVYVTGWIKRGCRGIIGSNKKCARETVRHLLDDWHRHGRNRTAFGRSAALAAIVTRAPNAVLRDDWIRIDHSERRAGRIQDRPRVKATSRDALMKLAFPR